MRAHTHTHTANQPINQVTQGELVVMNVGQDAMTYDATKPAMDGGGMGFGVPPHSNRTLALRFIRGGQRKFALRFVSSC